MEGLSEVIAELRQSVKKLEDRVTQLETENADLKAENQRLRNPKNSRNSSVPPSMDVNRPGPQPNQSLRPESKRPTGGQKGHKGTTLNMSQTPDETISLKVEVCSGCHQSLLTAEHKRIASRQVVDIPPVHPVFTQFDQYQVCCPHCARVHSASFPESVKGPVQYGPRVVAMIAYLSSRQYLSMARIAELCTNFFGLPLSEGTVANHLKALAHKGIPHYMDILEALRNSTTYVGADETGCRIEAKRNWMWTLENERHTFLIPSRNRASKTLSALLGVNPLPAYTLLHDCYSAYFRQANTRHQICLAHIRRDLQYAKELEPANPWLNKMDDLLMEAILVKKQLKENNPDPAKWEKEIEHQWRIRRKNLEKTIIKWINSKTQKMGEQARKIKNRLIRYQDSITRFLHEFHLPPDNNGSERAIRNVKVKTKVSGQFKTYEGALYFAIFRTLIDTQIKQNRDPYDYLVTLASS